MKKVITGKASLCTRFQRDHLPAWADASRPCAQLVADAQTNDGLDLSTFLS